MDAFEIAQLMADQDPKNPLRMRYGTVKEMSANGSVSIVPDGQAVSIPAVKCCNPSVGSRVVLLINGTEWLAVSVIGGDGQPEKLPDVLFDNPSQPMAGGITLSASAAIYDHLDLWCKDDEGHLVGPFTAKNGMVTMIQSSTRNPSSGMYVKSKAVLVKGTYINTYCTSEGYWTGIWSSNGLNQIGDYLAIIKVLGCK